MTDTKKQDLVLYEDKELTRPVTEIDFGRPFPGKTYTKKLFLANHNERWNYSEISCNESTDESFKINYPQFLRAQDVAEVNLSWSPTLEAEEPLDIPFLFTGVKYVG